jgi:hypothetical protein
MKTKNIIAAAALLCSARAMAATNYKAVDLSQFQPTPQEFAQEIAELQISGVIENDDGHWVLKDESALDQLRQDGRVDLVNCAAAVICF